VTSSSTSAERPIFVVGTGRSGTTLLRMMLSAHSRIHLCHEASFYVWAGVFPGKGTAEEFLAYYLRSLHFRWLNMPMKDFIDDVPRPLGPDGHRDLFTAVMRADARRHGKVRWGDKTPSHAANLGQIFEDFPDARVIRIIRDPRGVVRSLTQMPWASGTLSGGVFMCATENDQVEPYADRILQIRMEDLVADPRKLMEQVLAFVDEPWDEQVMHHDVHAPRDLPPVPWFANAAKPIEARGTPSWRSWGAVEIRLTERLLRQCLEPLGYARAELEQEPSSLGVLWRWLAELPRLMWDIVIVARIGLRMRDGVAFDAPGERALFRSLNPGSWDRWPGFEMPAAPDLEEGWERTVAQRGAGDR
jgi:hypothetical protein